MAISQETIRKITIEGEGQESLNSLAGSLDKVTASQQKLTTASGATATVTDVSTRRQLSAAEAYKRQTLAVDAGAKAQDQFTRAVKVLNAAVDQGIVGKNSADYLNRLSQLERKYLDASNATKVMSAGLHLATGALAAFGVGFGLSELAGWTKQVFNSTAGLVDQARQLQQTTDSLQAYEQEFRQSGSSAAEADKALARANDTVGQAVDNIGDARQQLSAWNVDWRQLAAIAPEQRLAAIAKGLLSIQDSGRRARAEQDLFGKSGHEIESVLDDLAGGLDRVIAKQNQLGTLKSSGAALEAKKAADEIGNAFQQLETKSSGPIVFVTHGLTGILLLVEKIGTGMSSIDWNKAGAAFGSAGGVPLPGMPSGTNSGQAAASTFQPLSKNSNGLTYWTPPPPANTNYSSALQALQQEATLAGATAEKRAIITAQLQLANGKLKDGLKDHELAAQYTGKQAVSEADILKILSPAEQVEGRRLGLIKAQGDTLQRTKETFAGFLAEEIESARQAGESQAQRETEQATIKAAVIAQREHGAAVKDTVKSYADAVAYLDKITAKGQQSKAIQIEIAEAQRHTNELGQQQDQQIQVVNAGLKVDADHRALIVQNLQDEIAAGVTIGAQYDSQRRQIEAKNAAIQAGMDATALKDYLQDLRDEASLAGLSADERERQAAVLQAMHITHGNLRADQSQEIQGIIAARQATEKWRQLVEDISGDFQNFFEDVLGKGKLSFGSLWDSVRQSFARMLAYMASQALVAPIIIPMVEQFGGALGAGGAGSLGGLSALGNLGSAGSLFGGGDILGLSSSGGLLSGLGSALGFSAGPGVGSLVSLGSIAGAGGAPVALGSISSATPALSGSLFGATTLGGFLGGAGLGSLASSLVFGNKNSAGIGGMGGALAGAAIGSIIPGIGTIIGGLVGGLAGGGLGSMTGTSNQGAIANFSNGGLGSYLFKQGGGNNGQLSTQAASGVSEVIKALQAGGVNVGLGNITGLSIGSDKSYVYDSAGGKQKLAGGDVEAVVQAILTRILPGASATNSQSQAILDRYNQNGGINSGNVQQVVADLGAAQQFADAIKNLSIGPDTISDGAKALKQINDQIDPLVKQAQSLGLATDNLEAIRTQATAALVQGFDDNVSASLKQLTDPVGAQFDALVKSQADRFKSAQDIGADVSKLLDLNNAELANFFKGLSKDQLASVQSDIRNNPAFQSANQAIEAQADAAKAQADAAAEAAKAQADAAASASVLADATNKVQDAQQNLTQAYSESLSKFQQDISQYRDSASGLRSYLQNVAQAGADPLSQYRSSKSAFLSGSSLAQTGDLTALHNLQQLADGFLSASKAGAQSLAQYAQDRALVIGGVSSAAASADNQADNLQRQLDALNQQIDGLITINNSTLSVRDAINDLNDALSVQAKATADNTAKMARILNNVTNGGDAMQVAS